MVQVGVIQNLAAFIAALTPATRLSYLPILAEVRAETDNWRFRHLLASQLAAFGAAYPHDAAQETLLPLALSLCTDTVAEVRLAGIAQIGKLVQLLVQAPLAEAAPTAAEDTLALADSDAAGERPAADMEGSAAGEAVRSFLETIGSMARAPSCYKRANCVQICASLVDGLPAPLVAEVLLPVLLPLANDRVANVRLALATLVKTRLLVGDSFFASLPITKQLIDILRRDVDRDVLRAAHPDGYEPPKYTCKQPVAADGGAAPPPLSSEPEGGDANDEDGAAATGDEALAAATAAMLEVRDLNEPDVGARAGD